MKINIDHDNEVEITLNGVKFFAVPVLVNGKPTVFIPHQASKDSFTIESGGTKIVQSGFYINELNVPEPQESLIQMPSVKDMPDMAAAFVVHNSPNVDGFEFETEQDAKLVWGRLLQNLLHEDYVLKGKILYNA